MQSNHQRLLIFCGVFSGLYYSIFKETSCIWFEYSVKALGSLQYFKPTFSGLLIENWYFSSYGS